MPQGAGEPRRLAAVMFTDMVGFTALTQSSEAQALELLERHNRLLRPILAKHEGREVKTIGDSFLVEFASCLDAINCAIEIQLFLRDYNLSSREGWRIWLRIGIHLGDVVRRDGDIFGDAVNVASRIQPLADPEGICISEQVFYQVRNKAGCSFERLEHADLKNVRLPTSLYKVVMPSGTGQKKGAMEPEFDRKRLAVLPFANISPDPKDEYSRTG